jgi:hypothetical protein
MIEEIISGGQMGADRTILDDAFPNISESTRTYEDQLYAQ